MESSGAFSRRQTGVVAINGQSGFVNPTFTDPALSEGAGAADLSIGQEREQLHAAVKKTAETLGIETSVSTYRELALSLIKDCPLKRDLVAFVDAEIPAPQESLVPVDAFVADSGRTDWHTHCPETMELWKNFCEKVNLVSNGQVVTNRMAAPSGPINGRVAMLWHYPTDTSPNQVFSHVMDPDSGTLRVQKIKNGMRRDMKTVDLIPIRAPYKVTGPEWEKTYGEQWPAIHQACVDHAQELLESDRFIFAIGGEVFPSLKHMIKSWGLKLTWLELDVSTKMWEKAPRIYIARDSSKKIQKVIFWTFHGQFSFFNKQAARGAVWDLLYNAGYELAGIPVLNYTYFEWKAGATLQRNWDNLASQVGAITDRDMYNFLFERETEQQKLCTIEDVQKYFPSLLERIPNLLEEIKEAVQNKGYSPLWPILRVFVRADQQKIALTRAEKRHAEPLPEPAPKKAHTAKERAYLQSDTLVNAQKKGHVTKRAQLMSKYDAFIGSFEVRQVEASRFSPTKSTEHARALPRLDAVKQALEEEDFRGVSTKLSLWVTFFSKEYPRGYRWSMDGGPAIPSPDPYQNAVHPAICLLGKSFWRHKAARLAAAGPLDEDDEDDEE
ncbi:hypothetical protein Neosp_013766 [[Neocosmospora] mangrovei]